MYSIKYDLRVAQRKLHDAGITAEVYDSLTIDDTAASVADKLASLPAKHKATVADVVEHVRGSKARQQARSAAARGF
jgi:hypothetical protein